MKKELEETEKQKLSKELEKEDKELHGLLETKSEASQQEYILAHVLENISEFTGSDGKYYPPLYKHDIIKIPKADFEKFVERKLVELTVLTPEQLKEIWEKAKRILRDGGIRKVELYRDRILSHLKYQISFEENLRIAEGEAREIIRTYKFPPEKPPAKIERVIREEIRRAFAPPPWAPQYPTSWEEIEEGAARIWGEEGRKIVREYREKLEREEELARKRREALRKYREKLKKEKIN